jgi:glycosyltransferase involved in cell wall biosynthesis
MTPPARPVPGVFSPRIQTFAVPRSSPRVSVVMTTWNDIRFMREAVDGILAQTMADFELIVVDDGSDFPGAVAALAGLDRRVRTLRLDCNLGAAEAGNRGIAMARAPIIARMDYDDRAEPGWLAAITAALDEDASLGVVGTWVTLISEHGDPLGIDQTPESDFAIRFTLLSHNPFYHSSAAYRRQLIDLVGGIETGQNLTHDHRLWRALLPHCRARNLPQPLCRYRYNPRGITGTSDPVTKRSRSRDIRIGLWRELGFDFPIEDRALGDAIDDFLRDRPSRHPEMWGSVEAVIESALAGTMRQEDSFLAPAEKLEPIRLAEELRSRIAAGPKSPPSAFIRFYQALHMRGPVRTAAALGRKIAAALPQQGTA